MKVSTMISCFFRKALSLILSFAIIAATTAEADLQIHFLDVGQGDAAIILCDGEAMMIDGGLPGASQFIYSYIRNTLKLDMIEVMVATHPHDDHIGGLAAALNAVPVELIVSPVLEWDSRPFNSMLKYAEAQGTPITTAFDGDTWHIGGALVTVIVCWPEAPTVNDMSIMLRIDYGSTSFVFTGDAGIMTEYIGVANSIPLKADVLKVGHHGSKTSSSLEFLTEVFPAYAVISCGKGNSYGHPNQETLNLLKFISAKVYRTDLQGTIICTSNGKSITWQTERTTDEDVFKAP